MCCDFIYRFILLLQLIVAHFKEQNTALTNQVAEFKTELEWARKTEQSLIDSQVSVETIN
jgi:FtsZ-binding cell division protein ZapB